MQPSSTRRQFAPKRLKDPSDIEEFLLHLGNLELEVRRQYEVLEKGDKDMLPYEKLRRQVPS